MTVNPLDAVDIEKLANTHRLSMAQVCREAKISQTTFQRWKSGGDLKMSTYRAIVEAIDTLSQQVGDKLKQPNGSTASQTESESVAE